MLMQRLMRFRVANILLVSLLLFVGSCASFGPTTKPESKELIERSLPAEHDDIIMWGAAFWWPNAYGFNMDRDPYSHGPGVEAPIPGVLVLTQSALYIQQWDSVGNRFVVTLRIPYETLRDCSIDKFGVNRCFVVQTKAFAVCSFQYIKHQGFKIDSKKTLAAYEFIQSKLSK